MLALGEATDTDNGLNDLGKTFPSGRVVLQFKQSKAYALADDL